MTELPPTAAPRNELPQRRRIAPGLLPDEVRAAQRKRWEATPEEVWFSKWAPLPGWVPRGPYLRATPVLVAEVEVGLRRVLGDD
ncbi:hypothetical protein ACWGCW_19770 [Streptomyces sp. NPDC054933]